MDLKHSSAQIDAIRNHILEDKEPCSEVKQQSSIEKLFNALALIGTTYIVIAHL
jgi:hypothetical protein